MPISEAKSYFCHAVVCSFVSLSSGAIRLYFFSKPSFSVAEETAKLPPNAGQFLVHSKFCKSDADSPPPVLQVADYIPNSHVPSKTPSVLLAMLLRGEDLGLNDPVGRFN